MSYSRRSRYASESRSPYDHRRSPSKSLSRSRSRSRSRPSSDVENPGNNLYVTGLPARISKVKLEEHFAKEGKVTDVHLVVDPLTRESRGFGFVTMATLEDADRCLKHLDGSALEGRVITVEKARRRRGRTPTPGRYLGLRTVNARRRSPSYSPIHRGRSRSRGYSSERSRSYSPYYRRHRSRSYSPCHRRHKSRSYSPYYRRRRSRSYYRRNRSRSYSPYHKGYRSRSPYNRYDPSPIRKRHRSYSQDSRSYTPEGCASPHCRRDYYRHSISRSTSPVGRRSSRRYYLQSVSPPRRRRSRRSYSQSVPRSYSGSGSPPHGERRRSRSCSSTKERRSRSSPSASCSASPSRRNERRHSRESYSHSRSLGSPSRSVPSRSR